MKSMPCALSLSGRGLRRGLAVVARGALAVLPLPALAISLVGGPQQISNGGPFNGFGASLSADGSRMAFYSAGNQVGGNGDNSFEVYVYDRPTNAVARLTDMPGGSGAGGHQTPRISGDGSRVVYQQFVADGGFVDFQTFTRQLNTGVTTPVTPRNDFFESSAISHDGSRIVVSTDNTGLRVFDTTTNTLGGAFGGSGGTFAVSGDGSRIARAGFNGSVNLIDLAAGTTQPIAPAGAGLNSRPDISSDGRFVAFTGNFNPLGSNADGSGELFVFDTQINQLRQATNAAGGAVDGASISADGSRVAFSSTANLLGTNADGNQEIYLLDLLEGSLLQVTDTVGFSFFSVEAELSADGRWLGFTSSGNFGGANPDRSTEVFLVGLSPQVTAALPLPGTAALVLAAGLGCGLATRRRRR